MPDEDTRVTLRNVHGSTTLLARAARTLPPEQRASPGETRPEAGHAAEIAGLYLPVADYLVEQRGNRGSRDVPVAIDVVVAPVGGILRCDATISLIQRAA